MPDAPIVIAHRGASGYLPEHTLEAKALAFGLGVDFLEQDVIATRDGELVVLHDLHLDDVTDVAERFPGRHREDGRHYAIDFDLAEIQQLAVSERRRAGSRAARFPGRFPPETAIFRVATLGEELALVAGLNRSMRRNVGIYPEIKHPQWHRAHGVDLGRLLIDTLSAHGYRDAGAPVFVQCFDATELRRVREELGCKLRLVQLVGVEAEYGPLLSGDGLAGVARYADALGPSYAQILATDSPRDAARPSELARNARALGLALHPYTFRRDELPSYATSLEELLGLFLGQLRVDGVFCDQPDVAVRVRDRLTPRL